MKVCRERFAGPEFGGFRARLWLRGNGSLTIVARLTAVSVTESQAQRIFTLKNGAQNFICQKLPYKSVLGKGLRHVIGTRRSKIPR